MITVKQIDRTWTARQYERLYRDLITFRPEANLTPEPESGWAAPAAAMALIRMDELDQSYVPLYSRLVKALIACQQADGSWGDLVTTALCCRALLCGQGEGIAIDRGIAFLANCQKSEGPWPRIPLRRMPEDAAVTVAILTHLGADPAFQSVVRLDDVLAWLQLNEPFLDLSTRQNWSRISRRCRHPAVPIQQTIWC